jgi:uncharacterized repeat protein (TIGR01451 family)
MVKRVKRFGCSLPVFVFVSCCLFAGSASAVVPGAGWSVDPFATPTNFSTAENSRCESDLAMGGQSSLEPLCDAYSVTVTNAGSQPTAEGSTVTLTDTLPAGVTVRKVTFEWSGAGVLGLNPETDLAGFGLCSVPPAAPRCELPFQVQPDDTLRMVLYVTVAPGGPVSFTDTVSVSGGGVGEASGSVQSANSTGLPLFGVSAFASGIFGLDGAPDTQAGDHPYEYTQTIDLNNGVRTSSYGRGTDDTSVQDLRDVVVDLPLGFVGSAVAVPTCTLAQLSSAAHCPPDTTIGHIVTKPYSLASVNSPIWNVVPERGVAAEYGFVDGIRGSHVLYANVAATPAGYVLRATSPEIAQIAINQIIVNLYGNPALRDGFGNTPVAQFTNPSDCSAGALTTAIHMDSWQNPARFNADGTPDFSDPTWASGVSSSPPVTGCDLLRFTGSIAVQPETTAAATPSGLNVELQVPQNETPGALATPPLRKAVVTLPEGLSLNPSAAGGLAACSLAQIGLGTSTQPSCPEASKIGSVEASTPALAGVLQGSIYLAAQGENPFHTLLAAYIVVDDPTTGVLIKVPGRLDPDPVTGRLTATFDEAPQFQVSDLKLHFFGGPRAPLVTPAGCGTYTTSASLTPWSAPDSGPPAAPSDSFQINSGCGGGFSPVFTAGTTNNQAGAFSPFTATFSRTDEDQDLAGITVKTPPGLLGILKGVQQCPEPQANQGTCGPGSLIGHATVAAGAGPNPFYVQGGRVFLTGPYKGAPFGLSFVVPAVAGPFDLGNVVVRAAISVDPHTAQITVTSDALPRILQGVPLDVRTVNVTIDRQGFLFNPTSCEALSVGGTVTSTQGASAQVSSRFQAANCANLGFKPSFTVSTQASTSKKNGASLDVKVAYPTGPQANIHSVAVTLPKALPSRLSTIQQACPEATFNANPATCPAGSNIGTGTARTPVLSNPVTGPAYLVSHGGAAFPDLVMILQGEGVTLELIGSINIKKQVTSSAFSSVPDAPISSFELKLPEGPHSGLAAVLPAKAKGNLCGTSLTMPTTLTAQNGAQIKQNTKIQVTGCTKTKKKKAKAHKQHKQKKGRKK